MKKFLLTVLLLSGVLLTSCDHKSSSSEEINDENFTNTLGGSVDVKELSAKPLTRGIYRVKLIDGRDTIKFILYSGDRSDVILKY